MPGLLDPNEVLKNMSPEERAQFGTVIGMDDNIEPPTYDTPTKAVGTQPSVTELNVEEKISTITTPKQVTLKLSPEQQVRLERACSISNTTPEEYITSLVSDALDTSVGKALISGPSQIGKVKLGKRITGPSNKVFT